MLQRRVSVIIPALNEQENIEAAVASAHEALAGRVEDYELLLFDDGSTDQTGAIMERIASTDSKVRVTHHERPRNLGGVYKHGIALARYEYIFLVPGDNENPTSAIIPVVDLIGRADIIVPYAMNQHDRPLHRRIGSRGYTFLMNHLFGIGLKYFNGTVIHRTDLLRTIPIHTDSFGYQAEILVKTLRAGASFHEVGIRIDAKPASRKSNALTKKNLMAVGQSLGDLFLEVHLPQVAAARRQT